MARNPDEVHDLVMRLESGVVLRRLRCGLVMGAEAEEVPRLLKARAHKSQHSRDVDLPQRQSVCKSPHTIYIHSSHNTVTHPLLTYGLLTCWLSNSTAATRRQLAFVKSLRLSKPCRGTCRNGIIESRGVCVLRSQPIVQTGHHRITGDGEMSHRASVGIEGPDVVPAAVQVEHSPV